MASAFYWFWARLNCENMAVIPTWIVRSNFDDPRKIPLCDALVLLDLKVRIRHSRTDDSNEERHNI